MCKKLFKKNIKEFITKHTFIITLAGLTKENSPHDQVTHS